MTLSVNRSWSGGPCATLIAVAIVLVALGVRVEAWGPAAHRMVHERAIDGLPKELKGFYKRHRKELPTLAPDLDVPPEGPERRFLVDRLAPYPFLDLPESEEAIQRRYPDAGDIGRLPWMVQEAYARLVEAMKGGEKVAILEASDNLAGLLLDLHNPLALTENNDGQRSRQPGVWLRISVRLPQTLEGRVKIKPDVAYLVDDPNGFVFSIIRATYVWLDNVLYEEDLATRRSGGRTDLYYDNLLEGLKPLIEIQLNKATRHIASYWYTAWVAAGRPELR